MKPVDARHERWLRFATVGCGMAVGGWCVAAFQGAGRPSTLHLLVICCTGVLAAVGLYRSAGEEAAALVVRRDFWQEQLRVLRSAPGRYALFLAGGLGVGVVLQLLSR